MKHLYEIYDGYEDLRKGEKKLFGKTRTSNRDAYAAAMRRFRDTYEEDVLDTCAQAAESADPAGFLSAYGQRFMDEAERILAKGKQKVPRTVKVDSTFFTVMYVIPLIRLCGAGNRDDLAEAVRAAWSERFGEPDMKLTSYQDIFAAFNTKFLGFL